MKRNQEVAKEAEKIKKAETEVEMKIMREVTIRTFEIEGEIKRKKQGTYDYFFRRNN